MMNFDDDFNEVAVPLPIVQSNTLLDARFGPPKPPSV